MTPSEPIADRNMIVVLPVCDRDGFMMTKNLLWMADLDGVNQFDAVVSLDSSTYTTMAKEVVDAARKAFRTVTVFKYDMPPETKWPNGANWAFQSTAWRMIQFGRPWFWLEADCIPLRPGWLKVWQAEYDRCSKPIMGAVIKERGWINGTAVYPHNFCDLSPRAMKATDLAWDFMCWPDIAKITHNSNHLMEHCWGIVEGKPSPHSGVVASFPTHKELEGWVPPRAVLWHRNKDGTLIDRLRERLARQKYADSHPDSKLPKRQTVAALVP